MKALLKKKNVLTAIVVVLLMASGIAVTLAYISDKTGALVNTFTVGNVTTEIVEDFQPKTITTFSKSPVVVNTGENDCYVRARITCSPEGALQLTNLAPSDSSWKYNEKDGFYYYNEILTGNSGDCIGGKTTPLFEDVEVTDTTIDGFEVTVYQEAVQTIVYAADGTYTDVMDSIWECYKKGEVPSTFNESN